MYDDIFKDLNAAQAVLAVLIFREVENERKRPASQSPPPFLPYASHYIAMLIGSDLLKQGGLRFEEVSHDNFQKITKLFSQNVISYHEKAVLKIQEALTTLYGKREISLQQLSATFRRGDLLEELEF